MALNIAEKIILTSQRLSTLIPSVARRRARIFLSRMLPKTSITGWNTTLIGGLPLGPIPTAESNFSRSDAPSLVTKDLSPRLKCLVVTGVLDVGGTDEVAAFLARRLPEYGIDCVVAHTGSALPGVAGGRIPAMLRSEGILVEEVTHETAEEFLARTRPDVISAHCPPAWWVEVANRARVPFVETLHGMHNFFGADWEKEAQRSAGVSKFIAVSDLIRRQYLTGNLTIQPERIITVENSVDTSRLAIVDRDKARSWLNLEDEFLFISLARHSIQKNGYGLITAFAQVAASFPETHLLIAGRPDDSIYAQQLCALRNRLACRQRIHLRDHAPFPAVLLAAADAFVMNSYFEGYSLASIEALYVGLPVVLSEVGGAKEQIGEGRGRGYLVGNPLGDPLKVDWSNIRKSLYRRQANEDELAEAMSRVIRERKGWSQARSKLQAESALRFDSSHALRGHANVLRGSAGLDMEAQLRSTGFGLTECAYAEGPTKKVC